MNTKFKLKLDFVCEILKKNPAKDAPRDNYV
jgi:hypothetical protein